MENTSPHNQSASRLNHTVLCLSADDAGPNHCCWGILRPAGQSVVLRLEDQSFHDKVVNRGSGYQTPKNGGQFSPARLQPRKAAPLDAGDWQLYTPRGLVLTGLVISSMKLFIQLTLPYKHGHTEYGVVYTELLGSTLDRVASRKTEN